MQVIRLFLAVACVSCSFPDVDFAGGPAGGEGPGAGAAEGGMGSIGGNGGTAPIGGAAACDADQDGALVLATGCCSVPEDCDCDDDDGDVFPGQMLFFSEKRKNIESETSPLAYDYDCDGQSEPELEMGTCQTLGCAQPTTKEVFQPADQYACGAVGNRRYCATLMCQQDPTTLRCR